MRHLITALLIGSALLAGCGSADEGVTGENAGDDTADGGDLVAVVDLAFEPDTITVEVGDTVTWNHTGDLTHTVTSLDDAFDSGELGNGASFSHTFEEAGTFAYHCSLHTQMEGTVEVA